MLNVQDRNKIKVFRCIVNAIEIIRAKEEFTNNSILETFKNTSKLIFEPAVEFETKLNFLKGRRRHKNICAEKLQVGNWPFNAPFGYTRITKSKYDSVLIPNKDSLYVLAAFFWRYYENQPLAAIARRLTNLGCKKGEQVIDRILSNPFYAGILEYDGETYKANFEPIISERIFFNIHRERTPLKYKYKEMREGKFPLNGLIKLNYNNVALSGYVRARKKVIHTYYKSRTRGLDKCINIKTVDLHNLFNEFYQAYLKQIENEFASSLKENHRELSIGITHVFNYMATQCVLAKSLLLQVQSLRNPNNAKLIANIENRIAEAELQTRYWCEFMNEDLFIAFGKSILEHQDWDSLDFDLKKELQKLWFPDGINFDHRSRTFSKIQTDIKNQLQPSRK